MAKISAWLTALTMSLNISKTRNWLITNNILPRIPLKICKTKSNYVCSEWLAPRYNCKPETDMEKELQRVVLYYIQICQSKV